jgi:hypothetical protein
MNILHEPDKALVRFNYYWSVPRSRVIQRKRAHVVVSAIEHLVVRGVAAKVEDLPVVAVGQQLGC